MLGRYDSNEFESIEYMATSGGLGNADSDARIGYYRITGFPHLLFDGGNDQVGAGTDAINGSVYEPIVQNMLPLSSPIKMGISNFSFADPGAFVTVDLDLEQALTHPVQTKLRIAILEDNLNYGGTFYDNVLRDMLDDQALSISLAGESEQVTVNFTPDPSWNVANLRLVAFVQNDNFRSVLQSCNSKPTPDYSLRYYAEGDPILINSGLTAFGQSGLFNAGKLADTYDVTLDISGLPAGWSASFAYDGSDYTNLSVALAPDERALFDVAIDAASTGEGEVTLKFHSQSGLTADRQIVLKVITPDVEILLVDDDGGENYDSRYFAPAIATQAKTFATWDRGRMLPTAVNMANFDMVIWECGWSFPTVTNADRTELAAYLNGGGNLFVTGQDIGWEMGEEGAAAMAWYNNYLHATYVADDSTIRNLQGVAGDPITDGMTLVIQGGDGANNQDYPSDIDPRDASASTILTYSVFANGGIKADTGTYRVVYLAFGFEAINTAADRAQLMQNIINWLVPGESAVGDGLPVPLALHGNVPNPFNPLTHIKFSVGDPARVKLGVYDVKGRLVRTLSDGLRGSGEHDVVWDGLDGAGRSLPSGTYFGRVEVGEQTESVKMMLVR